MKLTAKQQVTVFQSGSRGVYILNLFRGYRVISEAEDTTMNLHRYVAIAEDQGNRILPRRLSNQGFSAENIVLYVNLSFFCY